MTTTYFPLVSRNRAERHPVAGLALAATLALAAVGITAQAGSPISDVSRGTAGGIGTLERDDTRSTPRTDRLRPASEADIACEGQSWGAQDGDCLVAIAKESGKTDFVRIRTISGA